MFWLLLKSKVLYRYNDNEPLSFGGSPAQQTVLFMHKTSYNIKAAVQNGKKSEFSRPLRYNLVTDFPQLLLLECQITDRSCAKILSWS